MGYADTDRYKQPKDIFGILRVRENIISVLNSGI